MTTTLVRKATAHRLQSAEAVRNIYCYIVEIGTQAVDLMQPEFWVALNMQLQPWDRIEVMEEGGAYFIELLVRSSGATGVIVQGLRRVAIEDGMGPRNFQPVNLTGAQIVYKGPFLQWVVEGKDGKELHGGFETETRAAQWLAQHNKIVAST